MSFKCDEGHFLEDGVTPWSSTSWEERIKHMADFPHEHSGYASCTDCGKPSIAFKIITKIKGKFSPSVYCDECILRLKEHINKLEGVKNE